MMTYEHAKAKLATTDAKIDFFAGLTEQIERMIDEIESARHDNVLWNFGKDWTLADNVKDGWDATETACEGLGYMHEVCEQQLTRERNKADKLNTYLTRLEGQAKPVTVTANSVDIDDDGAHCFDCGKYVADTHDMESGMWIQPSHERGTSNGTGCYAEFVCRECYDKHYHQCDECCESYHESRCTQDTNGNFICENCREAQAATDKVTANSADIADVQAATEKSPDQIADDLTAKLQQKICGATWHVHTRLQGDRGYRSLILNKLKVKADWYTGKGYDFYHHEVLAHYDTAAQVEEVIGRIGAVATFKETEFNFPHVAELTATEYREKLWAVDFDICHEDSDLTEEELRDYTDALSDAMTANGNRAHVELATCIITIYGDSDGDNLTVDKIVAELETRGCYVGWPEDEDTAE